MKQETKQNFPQEIEVFENCKVRYVYRITIKLGGNLYKN